MLQSSRTSYDIQAPPRREPPYSIEAEQALLGAALLNADALERVSDILTAEHFFDPLHASIYADMSKLVAQGKKPLPVVVAGLYNGRPPITDTLTIPQYIGRLAARATTVINARDYARTIVDLATRRSLIIIGEDLAIEAYDVAASVPPSSLVDDAEAKLFRLAERSHEGSTVLFSDAAAKAVARVNAAYMRGGRMSGLSTGLADLDNKLGGLQNSDLVILAGRPSMGKTSLATNIAWHIAKNGSEADHGEVIACPVGFFSLEMSDEQLALRILSAEAGISSEKLRRGTITENQMRLVLEARERRSSVPLVVDDRGGITIAQLASRARRMKRRYGIKLLVIDYLQLLGGTRKDGRTQEITEITVGLKSIAKELDIPVIALSQLSRETEKRGDKRPQLSDLRESGSIEQDADVVMFVYREEYYIERERPDETDPKFMDWQANLRRSAGKAEVIIGKQRHGPVGVVPVAFDGTLTRFSNLAKGDMP